MPPCQNAIDECKDEILQWYYNGQKQEDIAEKLCVNVRTLRRRLKEWGARKISEPVFKQVPGTDQEELVDPLLRAQLRILYVDGLTDDEMLRALRNTSWHVNKRVIRRFRKSEGWQRRISAYQQQQYFEAWKKIIQEELDDGTIEGYGKGHLIVHFRKLGMQISRYNS
jgi:hypothetical protein